MGLKTWENHCPSFCAQLGPVCPVSHASAPCATHPFGPHRRPYLRLSAATGRAVKSPLAAAQARHGLLPVGNCALVGGPRHGTAQRRGADGPAVRLPGRTVRRRARQRARGPARARASDSRAAAPAPPRRQGAPGRRRRGAGRSIGSRIPAARVSARRPSARAWWNLNSTAKEPPSAPGSTWASHGGRPRSSGRPMRRPARAWKSVVGACSRTWSSGSKAGSGSRVAPPNENGRRRASGGCQVSRIRIRSPGTAGARAASRSAAWAPAVGESAVKTPSAPRCMGCSADSMFQNARSRGASGSGLKGLPRKDDAWTTDGQAVNRPPPITVKYDQATHS